MHKLFLHSDRVTFSTSKHSNIKEVIVDDLSLVPDFLQHVLIRGKRQDIQRTAEVIDCFLELFPGDRHQLLVENGITRIVLQEVTPAIDLPVSEPETSVTFSSAADMYRNLQTFFDQRTFA